MSLHDIIQKNSEKLLNDADNLYSLAWQDGREGLNRRAEINTEFGSLIESSQISIIQAIDEWAEENKKLCRHEIAAIDSKCQKQPCTCMLNQVGSFNAALIDLRSFLNEAKTKLQ